MVTARIEWSPILSVNVIIMRDQENWMSAERESNLFSRVIITDRIGRKSYYKFIIKIAISENELKINKIVLACLKNCCVADKVKYSSFCFDQFLRGWLLLFVVILVADWSESQELRL